MAKIITVPIPHDLPENWNDLQYVSPGGVEVGLTEKHGFNYLMQQVNNAHLALEQLDAHVSSMAGVGKNLLHNWYMRSPINTKEGYFIPMGSNYYSSEALTTKVGTTPYAITPSYIGSTYASYVLSGTTFYVSKTSLSYGYIGSVDGSVCIDRWRLKSQTTIMVSTIELQDSGCKLSLAKQLGDFYQDVSKAVKGSTFRGMTYTFSVRVESVSGANINMYITAGSTTKQTRIQSAGVHSVSIQVTEGTTKLIVGIKNADSSNSGTIKISEAKLEVGSTPTIDLDPPADRAEQMAICIQYDPNTDEYRGFTALTTANILADASITE